MFSLRSFKLARAVIVNSNRRLWSLSEAIPTLGVNLTHTQRGLHLSHTVPRTKITDQSVENFPFHHRTRNIPFQSSRRHLSFGGPNVRYTRFAPGAGGKQRRVPTFVVILISGGVSYYLLHLERVPDTGRLRFMDISPRYEAELANVTHAELLKEFQHQILPVNHPITRHVRRVVTSILEANELGTLSSGQDASLAHRDTKPGALWEPYEGNEGEAKRQMEMRPGKEWNLLVVNDEKVVNAMASFNNIIVFTGILPICRDENGLAAVLGHEIGHVVARHPSERASVSKFLIFGVYLLCYIGFPVTAAAGAVKVLLDLPNSRKQELEADRIGLKLSSRACFEPRAAIEMHHRLDMIEKSHGRLNVSFLYTHPTGEQRVKLLTDLLPEAYRVQEESPYCAGTAKNFDAFRRVVRSIDQPLVRIVGR